MYVCIIFLRSLYEILIRNINFCMANLFIYNIYNKPKTKFLNGVQYFLLDSMKYLIQFKPIILLHCYFNLLLNSDRRGGDPVD